MARASTTARGTGRPTAGTRPTTAAAPPEAQGTGAVNEVRLRGRLAAASTERDLPSGDVVAGFNLIVERTPERRRRTSRIGVDTFECSAFGADLRRKVARFAPGDVVEVTGHLERGFSRDGRGGVASRYRIVVGAATRVARAPAAQRATMAG